ncbi:MAG TPA: hypothetical protein VJ736_11760 [Actinomycetota bacterium]|jgi:hypothetical protein|nr:hypothetical protein [Actinomycetota bacterium]
MKDERGPLNKAMADERSNYLKPSYGGIGMLVVALGVVAVIFLLAWLLR